MRARFVVASLLLASSALAQQTPLETPPVKQEGIRSPLMVGTGIGMVIAGPIAAITATAVLLAAHGSTTCISTRCMQLPADRGEIAAGAVVLSIGATAALGGIVMIVLGGMRVPVKNSVWLTPDGIGGRF